MSKPDIQNFTEDGTWVKSPGAVRVEVTLKGGDGGASSGYVRTGRTGGGRGGASGGESPVSGYTRAPWLDKPGTEGETVTRSFAADDLPDLMEITVGQPGGFASVITHLDNGEQQR